MMKIEACLNNVHVRQTCVSCGVWERPDEVAYFVDGDWVCDECVALGVDCIRDGLKGHAAHFRQIADNLERDAAGEIEILPLSPEDAAVAEQWRREWAGELGQLERERAEKGELPF